MKRIFLFLSLALLLAAIGRAAYHAATAPEKALSKYVPAGSLLYLEARDLSSLLADWNSSTEKKQWVTTSNYEVFSRSRLLLRLQGASAQFAAAAGIPPSMDFLSQVAGTRSALALYDIGNLEFLYVTYLPSGRSMQTTLWQTRAKFEPRNAGGVAFYVRSDPESQKQVAFAVSGDYLLLATREDLLAGALQLMSKSQTQTQVHDLASEPWWSQAVASAGPAGDLRMVMNLEKIVPSPYFRTYWVQQNITEMKQYSAAVSDLFRSLEQYREERVLLRKSPASPVADTGLEEAASLIRLIPERAAIYETKAYPSGDSCFDLIETKLLAPHSGPALVSEMAPEVQLTSGETGGGSDLETRIDQQAVAPIVRPQGTGLLKALFEKTQILASLQVQSTERDPSGVFIRIHSAIGLAAASDWNEPAVQAGLTDFLRPGLTAGEHGIVWEQSSGYYKLDGLWPLALAVRGKVLMIADDPALIKAMLAGLNRKSDVKSATLIAGFNHRQEQSNFARFFGLVDRPTGSLSDVRGMDRQPQFFSDNMTSLSATLADVSAERVVQRAEPDRVLQTVTYEWSR
ncbi:MAG: hypothetical protein WCA47_02900 [Terriglobales bacterium]